MAGPGRAFIFGPQAMQISFGNGTPDPPAENRQAAVSPRADLAGVLWESAAEAFGSALVVWFLGGFAFSLAASFAGDMIPSAPPIPGLAAESPEGHHGAAWHWAKSLRGNAYVFLFAAFFAHSLWTRLRRRADGRPETSLGRRLGYMLAKLREDWFGLIVGNAIRAWVGALILSVVSGFGLTQMLWHWAASEIFSGAMDPGGWNGIGPWVRWYDENQMKLTFWFLYVAGMCDDLGLPNYKTLGRWLWRRWKRHNAGGSYDPGVTAAITIAFGRRQGKKPGAAGSCDGSEKPLADAKKPEVKEAPQSGRF